MIFEIVGIAFLDIIIGLFVRVLLGGMIYHFIKVKALVTGIPFLGIIAWLFFPSMIDSNFMNFGFYLTDFAATILFFTEKGKKDATTN
jgi:hypothetical protein